MARPGVPFPRGCSSGGAAKGGVSECAGFGRDRQDSGGRGRVAIEVGNPPLVVPEEPVTFPNHQRREEQTNILGFPPHTPSIPKYNEIEKTVWERGSLQGGTERGSLTAGDTLQIAAPSAPHAPAGRSGRPQAGSGGRGRGGGRRTTDPPARLVERTGAAGVGAQARAKLQIGLGRLGVSAAGGVRSRAGGPGGPGWQCPPRPAGPSAPRAERLPGARLWPARETRSLPPKPGCGPGRGPEQIGV